MTMNQFLLRPLKALGKVTDEQVDQLRSIPGVRVSCVLTYIVAVSFDGDQTALQALLPATVWNPQIGECRVYRLQTAKGPAAGQSGSPLNDPLIEDVLMQFAVERSLPTRAHLDRYLEAFPQFRQELIEFAVSLVEDHFHPEPLETND
jgi:hypothetical protein